MIGQEILEKNDDQSKLDDQTVKQQNFQNIPQLHFDRFQKINASQFQQNKTSNLEKRISQEDLENQKLNDTLGNRNSLEINSDFQSPKSPHLHINLNNLDQNSNYDSISYYNHREMKVEKNSNTTRNKEPSTPQHSPSHASTPYSKRRNNAVNLDNQLNNLITNYSKKVYPYDKVSQAIQQKKKRDSFSLQLKNDNKQGDDSDTEDKQKNKEEQLSQGEGESEQQIKSCHAIQNVSNELSNSVQTFQVSHRSSFHLNLPQFSTFKQSNNSQSKPSPTGKRNTNNQSPKLKTKVNQFINTFNFTSSMDVNGNNMNSSSYKLTNLLNQSFYQNTPNNTSSMKNQVVTTAGVTKFSNMMKSYSIHQNWRTALNIIKVHQFKKILLGQIQYKLNHSLNQNQLNLLDDKSYFVEKKQYNFLKYTVLSKFSLFLYKTIQILNQIGTFISQFDAIQPNTFSLIIWKSIYILISFWSFYYYSLQGAFAISLEDIADNYIWLSIFFYIFNIFFVIDMVIDLNTGYYLEGVVQHSRVNILKNSLMFDFWVHSLKIFLQFYYFTDTQSTITSYLLCFLHLYSMSKNSKPIDQHWQIQQKHPIIRLVILLLIVILTVAHLSGCFFYSLSQVQSNYYIADSRGGQQEMCNNWVSCSNLDGQNWIIKYIFSLYFSFITMITVGYGDIFPVSVYEKIYVIGMTCITCGIFGYAINKISSVINELAQKQYSQKQEQYEIINYMDNRQISQQTQIKVLKYIEHVQEKEKENPINGQLILKKISKTLKKKVQEEYFGTILQQCKLLTATFSQMFLEELMVYMNEALYSPDEVIFNSDETTESALYFLVDGNIGKFQHNSSNQTKMIQSISKKQFIGLTNFISQQKEENTTYKTIETSLIVSLQYKDFLSCLKSYPNDLEKYHNIKQQILQNSSRLEACQSCGLFSHSIQQCSLIHLSLNSQLIKMKYQYSQSQLNRDPSKKRRREQGINTYSINRQIKKDIRLLRSNLVLQSRGHEEVSTPFETDDINYESDKNFFIRVAQVRISQNVIKTIQDLNDTGIDSSNSISYSSSDNSYLDVNNNGADRIKDQNNSLIEELDEEHNKDDNFSRSLIFVKSSKKKSLQQNIEQKKNSILLEDNQYGQFNNNYSQKRYSIQLSQPISLEQIQDDPQFMKKSDNFSITSYSNIKNYQPKESNYDKQIMIKSQPRQSLFEKQNQQNRVSSFSQLNNNTYNQYPSYTQLDMQNKKPFNQFQIQNNNLLQIPQNHMLQIPQHNQLQSQSNDQFRLKSKSLQRSSMLSYYSQQHYAQKSQNQNQSDKQLFNQSQYQNKQTKYNNSKIFDEDAQQFQFDINQNQIKKRKESILVISSKIENIIQTNDFDQKTIQKEKKTSNKSVNLNNRLKNLETEMKTTLPTYQDDFNQLEQIQEVHQNNNFDNHKDQSFQTERDELNYSESQVSIQLNLAKQESQESKLKQIDKANRELLKKQPDDKKIQQISDSDGKGIFKKENSLTNKEKKANFINSQLKIRQSFKLENEAEQQQNQNIYYGTGSIIFKSQNDENLTIQKRDSSNQNQYAVKPYPQNQNNNLNSINISNIPNLNRNSSTISNNLLNNLLSQNSQNNPNSQFNNNQLYNKKLNSIILDEQLNQNNQAKSGQNYQSQNLYPEYSSLQNNQEELFIFDFEVGKEWVYFQPHNNQSIVVREHKKYLRSVNFKNRNGKSKMQTITRQVIKKKRIVKMFQDTKIQH
ncbi:cation channel family protein (macronuclear) [Tetrahymena thermophila SB210]|uniref:Cation channel family protein n=1 Tax=Tetrahymena thermophila (strain SB210) TaxID=312017 RepID=Q22VW7_TETTS|nr:cation channel family protein [Tetrahymena thermophila SB210]EAR89649.2 cation channel family protein [Tetrahymena thermophila SB210]|eukprot:XP_001009895.2 cation channel family protein [Tetrahymena thermophila SB210]